MGSQRLLAHIVSSFGNIVKVSLAKQKRLGENRICKFADLQIWPIIAIFVCVFSICQNVEPTLAPNCYWADFHRFIWPNVELMIHSYGHIGLSKCSTYFGIYLLLGSFSLL